MEDHTHKQVKTNLETDLAGIEGLVGADVIVEGGELFWPDLGIQIHRAELHGGEGMGWYGVV